MKPLPFTELLSPRQLAARWGLSEKNPRTLADNRHRPCIPRARQLRVHIARHGIKPVLDKMFGPRTWRYDVTRNSGSCPTPSTSDRGIPTTACAPTVTGSRRSSKGSTLNEDRRD